MSNERNLVSSVHSLELDRLRRFWHNPQIEQELLIYDVASSIAHVKMLGETGIIDKHAAETILTELQTIRDELLAGKVFLKPSDPNIHEGLERRLKEAIGDMSLLMRTAISYNDQIATDMRLWLRDAACEIFAKLETLRTTLIELAERDLDVVMPGYTHMQPAQPILLSHWWLAHEARFRRDFDRLEDFYTRLNILPLGACVLAGTKEPIERKTVADILGFDDVIDNSLDAVSDRDFLVEFGAFAAMAGLHLSQIGAELLLWATQEFGFVKLPKHFVVTSQNLPLKRNPELLEILRSRPSQLYGRLMEFIGLLKALPLGYSQDLQECIPGLYEMVDNLKTLLGLVSILLSDIEIDSLRMREVACADLLNVSRALDYLTARGVPTDKASKVVEALANYCRQRNKYLFDLELNEWQQFSPAFEADVYQHVSIEESVRTFCSFGGSSKEQVELALARAREVLALDIKRRPKQLIVQFQEGTT